MTTPWLSTGVPDSQGEAEITVMEGTSFCISDPRGDIGARETSGLFVRDTRMLSRWRLVLRERRLDPLRVHQQAPYEAAFLLFSSGAHAPDHTDLVVLRERFVGDGMWEDLTVRNAGTRTASVCVDLEVDADFADLFEVKDGRRRHGAAVHRGLDSGALDLSVLRDGAEFAVSVEPRVEASVDEAGLHWQVELPAHGSWSVGLQVVPRVRGERLDPHHGPGTPAEHAEPARRHRQFRRNAPGLSTADGTLASVLRHSIEDLATLRIFDPAHPDLPVVAAGAPWFMALFGRDSLITSLMLVSVDSSLAMGTVKTLASYLGTGVDRITEEQPGRVPHEVRFGPAGTLALGGRHAYYGSADSTPLFVMAVGELLRWEPSLVDDDLVAATDRALEWIVGDGDPDGDGFVEYARTTDRGLANQGWKDSWDGINFSDGSLPEAPIALAEVQAYAYAAFVARADIAESRDDLEVAERWRERAARLQARFDQAFWLPERGWYAVGLDRDKRPIDALTSNIGHCLWTGLARDERARQVAEHLLSPELFTGWGIRTLGATMGAFNPMSYHNGSVWPHDTAICVAGLVRYGFLDAAQQVALGLLDAAGAFGGRIPELFAGFLRTDFPVPVPYPAACSPQAWAAAAPVELLRSLLGLRPTPEGLECRPHLPERMLPLQLSHVACRGRLYDVQVDADGVEVRLTGDAT